MIAGQIEINRGELLGFCERNSIKRFALFGSVFTERFSDSSDVDVLVEFQPDTRVGYLRMAALERELSPVFGGRKVDLRTPGELSPYSRDEVMRTAAVQYAAE